MANHTPGPWVIDPTTPYGEDLLGLRSANGKVVAAVSLITNDEGPANALLVAAAPDLLEELEEAVKLIRFYHGEPSWNVYEGSPEMRRIYTAIAKARGEAH